MRGVVPHDLAGAEAHRTRSSGAVVGGGERRRSPASSRWLRRCVASRPGRRRSSPARPAAVHVGEPAQPHEPVGAVEIPELADDAHAERFLRLEELAVEQLDQDIASPGRNVYWRSSMTGQHWSRHAELVALGVGHRDPVVRTLLGRPRGASRRARSDGRPRPRGRLASRRRCRSRWTRFFTVFGFRHLLEQQARPGAVGVAARRRRLPRQPPVDLDRVVPRRVAGVDDAEDPVVVVLDLVADGRRPEAVERVRVGRVDADLEGGGGSS